MNKGLIVVMMSIILLSSLSLISGTSSAAPSFAYVHVEMEDGTPASGASVTLTNQVTGVSINRTTDSNGDCLVNVDVGLALPGFSFANFNETINVVVTKGDYSGSTTYTYSWTTGVSREWVNITLRPTENEPISTTVLIVIGGIGTFVLAVLAIYYPRHKGEKERPQKRQEKKRRRS